MRRGLRPGLDLDGVSSVRLSLGPDDKADVMERSLRECAEVVS